MHHETVGGEGEPRAVHFDLCRIAERVEHGAAEERHEKAFDEPPAGLTAGAM